MRVKLLVDGTILANDEVVSLDALGARLADLRKVEGRVCYYRESGTSEPHPNAIRIMELVVENQLPITLSTKPDFSDYVGSDGRPHRR